MMFHSKKGYGIYRDPSNSSFSLNDGDFTLLASDINGRLKLFSETDPEGIPSLGIKTADYSLPVVNASNQTKVLGSITNSSGQSVNFFENINPGCCLFSDKIDTLRWKKITIQMSTSSVMAFDGILHLEGSNLDSPGVLSTDWYTIPNSELSWSFVSDYMKTGILSSQPIDISYHWIRAVWVPVSNSKIKITPIPDDNYSLAGKSMRLYGSSTTSNFRSQSETDSYPGFRGPVYNIYFSVNGYGVPVTPRLPYYIIPLNVNATAKAISTTLSTILPSITTGGYNTSDLGVSFQPFLLPNITRTSGAWFTAALGSKRVIIQNGSSYIWVSTNDGLLWARYTNGSISSNVTSLKALGNRFVVTKASSTVITTSTDGITWTSIGTSAPSVVLDIGYDSSTSTWTCLTDNYFVVSTNNMVNWSSYLFNETIRGYGAQWTRINCNGSNWVAIGQSGKIARCVGTPSGSNGFNLIATGQYSNLHSICSNTTGTKFLTVGDGGVALQSSDSGASWTRIKFPVSNLTTVSSCSTWDLFSNKFVLVSRGYLLDSPDGIQWQVKLTPSNLSGNPIVCSSSTSGLTVISDSYAGVIDTFEVELIDDSVVFTSLPRGYGSNKTISTDTGFTIVQTCPSELASLSVSAFLI